MKRYNEENQKKAGKFDRSKDPWFKSRPHLDAFMRDAFWEDGKPRECCRISISAGTHQCVVSLNDSDAEQSITTTSETVEDALDRLEAYLASGNPSWRSWGKKKTK